jgi:hypothetical protein
VLLLLQKRKDGKSLETFSTWPGSTTTTKEKETGSTETILARTTSSRWHQTSTKSITIKKTNETTTPRSRRRRRRSPRPRNKSVIAIAWKLSRPNNRCITKESFKFVFIAFNRPRTIATDVSTTRERANQPFFCFSKRAHKYSRRREIYISFHSNSYLFPRFSKSRENHDLFLFFQDSVNIREEGPIYIFRSRTRISSLFKI